MGWLVNIKSTSIEEERIPEGKAGLDCYFIEEDGDTFKATLEYEPYFLIAVRRGHEGEVEEWCKRVPGEGAVKSLRRVEKEDLQMPNHLLGYRRTFLELRFANVRTSWRRGGISCPSRRRIRRAWMRWTLMPRLPGKLPSPGIGAIVVIANEE